MSYNYHTQLADLLKPENVPKLIEAKKHIDELMDQTMAIMYDRAMHLTGFCNSWQMLCCLDYFVEQGYYDKIQGCAGQYSILVEKGCGYGK